VSDTTFSCGRSLPVAGRRRRPAARGSEGAALGKAGPDAIVTARPRFLGPEQV